MGTQGGAAHRGGALARHDRHHDSLWAPGPQGPGR